MKLTSRAKYVNCSLGHVHVIASRESRYTGKQLGYSKVDEYREQSVEVEVPSKIVSMMNEMVRQAVKEFSDLNGSRRT